MDKSGRIVLYGFLSWFLPFFSGFPFVDAEGNMLIEAVLFKSIMIVVGCLVGVLLSVRYFSFVKADHVREGLTIGVAWLFINWVLDLAFVMTGFFGMTVMQYFKEIGLRYLPIPIYTVGMGKALEKRL